MWPSEGEKTRWRGGRGVWGLRGGDPRAAEGREHEAASLGPKGGAAASAQAQGDEASGRTCVEVSRLGEAGFEVIKLVFLLSYFIPVRKPLRDHRLRQGLGLLHPLTRHWACTTGPRE